MIHIIISVYVYNIKIWNKRTLSQFTWLGCTHTHTTNTYTHIKSFIRNCGGMILKGFIGGRVGVVTDDREREIYKEKLLIYTQTYLNKNNIINIINKTRSSRRREKKIQLNIEWENSINGYRIKYSKGSNGKMRWQK